MTAKILNHPSLLYGQEISDICKPLEKLNISYFSHVHIDHDKKFSAIGKNPEFTQHYLQNKYYSTDIHMIDENKFGDFFVWDGIEFSGQSAKMCQEAGGFGIHNPFTIIFRNKNGIDYYHFANDSENKQINQIYLTNLGLLHLFISHFNENINQSSLLTRAYDFKFDLSPYQQTNFEDESVVFDRSAFLHSMKEKKSGKLHLENICLSKRQVEVLKHVVHGKTLKEISYLLGLSDRTVSHYFETIKIKFKVFSRSELVAKILASSYKQFFLDALAK